MKSNYNKSLIINPMDFDTFVGMDVDKRSICLTILDHQGDEKPLKMPYNSANLIAYLDKHFSGKRIALAYEVGPTGYGLYDDLTVAGLRCLVVPPAHTPESRAQRVKTNRIDSRKLAYALRGGQLHSVHVPSPIYRQLRHLVALREVFVRQSRADKFRIKALLLLEGIPYPDPFPRAYWSGPALNRLQILPCEPVLRFKLDQLLASLRFADDRLHESNNMIRLFISSHSELADNNRLLITIPGIGHVVAAYILARIADPDILDNPRQLAALLGLVPTENSTSNRTRRGSITRLGDPATRNKLIETAWTSIRFDPELQEYYQRIRSRHPAPVAARKAIVAVARKLTTRIYAVLKYRQPYTGRNPHLANAI
jgi:transposase